MKRLLVIALLAIPAAAQMSSLAAGWGTATLPSGAPWNDLENFRMQFRLHNWSYNGNYQTIYGTSSYLARIYPSNGLVFTSWPDGSLTCTAYVPGGMDTTVVMQRDGANSRLICDAYNTQTGVLISESLTQIVTRGIPNDAGQAVYLGPAPQVAYVRSYSTVVPPGTTPGNTYDGDLTDYELNGSGADETGHADLNLTGAAYVSTPAYNPVAIFNPWPTINTFRAGTSIQLSAAASYTATDNATLSYLWAQTSGPAGALSSTSAVNPILSGSNAGAYAIQLTVTDSDGLSSSVSNIISAVNTDANYVVNTGLPAAADNILGPLTMSGSSPWIYFDLAEIATGNSVATNALANPPYLGPAISGTVQLIGGPIKMIGTGTHFTTDLTVGETVIVGWDGTDGPGTGRYVDTVTAIADDTHATLTQYNWYPSTIPTAAKVYAAPPNTPTFNLYLWWDGNIGTFWTFYDSPLAIYRLYYRTGNPAYLTQARQLADYQWQWMVDQGYGTPPPRGAALLSQFLRALDGHPERLPGLYAMVSFYRGLELGDNLTVPWLDLREAGYTQWFIAIGSKVDTDPTRHAQYCSWLSTYAPQWVAAQYPGGWWGEDNYANNAGYPSAPLTYSPLVFGASPWRTSILIKGLEATYEALSDTTPQGCNNPVAAASLLTTITKAVNWQWNYGRDNTNRGIWYEVQYPNNEEAATFPSGTASVNLGSTSVVGSGTTFTTAYACNGTDFIGFNASTSNSVYKVMSCADDTHLTITPAFGSYGPAFESSSITGANISETPAASSSCGTSLSSYCFVGAGNGDLNLDRLVPGEIAWLYNQTKIPIYRHYTDDFFGAAFGGPATGPNSSTPIGIIVSNPSGLDALGYIGDSIAALPDCNAPNPAPCVPGGNVFVNFGKNFDEASGAPGADNALAWRIVNNPTLPGSLTTGRVAARGTVSLR